MKSILQDLSATSLSLAIEENLSSWVPVFGRLDGAIINDIPGVKRSISNIPMALFNSLMDARLTPDTVESTINYILSDATRRNVPVLWWTGPSTRPSDLGTRLEKHGFTLTDDSPGMAVVLNDLNENLPIPAGLVIQSVHEDSLMKEWCRTMALGFEIPGSIVDFIVDAWHELLQVCNPDVTQAYIARLNGMPVATSLIHYGGGVGGIYAVATIPEARRKGIGAQVTLYPLLEARKLGYQAGVLGASEMGAPVYRKLGFQEYCWLRSYRWGPKISGADP